MDFGSLLSVAQKNAKTNTVSSEVSILKKLNEHMKANEKKICALIEYFTHFLYTTH